MLTTRLVNDWLHTNYSMEQVAEMDELLIDVLLALKQGMSPRRGNAN